MCVYGVDRVFFISYGKELWCFEHSLVNKVNSLAWNVCLFVVISVDSCQTYMYRDLVYLHAHSLVGGSQKPGGKVDLHQANSM